MPEATSASISTPTWPLVGHAAAVEMLARAVRSERPGHAYLISGPEGIGKRTLARIVAQALACTAPAAERPCGVCPACRRIERGVYPDVTEVSLRTQAADDRRERKNTRISIETVRELRASISLRPLESNWRVAIIEDVDFFSRDAFDALLKTLEEPPPFVVLLLIATEVEAVPETIRSRCHPVPLEPLSREAVAQALRERGTGSDEARVIASLTRGRIGHALQLAATPKALTERREAVATGLEMIGNPLVAIGGARRLADIYRRGQRERVESQLDLLLGLWRDLLLISTGCADQVVNADIADQLAVLASRWDARQIHAALRATYRALNDLSANAQPRLALDYMVAQWPQTR